MELAAIGSSWPGAAMAMAGVWLFAMGAVTASFLGVVAERGVTHEPITGRSHCACGRQLTWWELIPVVSWVWLGITNGGKAKCCQSGVPARYVLSEVGLGALWAGAIFVVSSWWIWGVVAALGMGLVVASNVWSAKR